jgi:hypothetical protein
MQDIAGARTAFVAVFLLSLSISSPAFAQTAPASAPACDAPPELTRLDQPLRRLAMSPNRL